jgi:hypothetical protein
LRASARRYHPTGAVLDDGQGCYGVIKTEHATTFSASNNTSDLSYTSACNVAVDLRGRSAHEFDTPSLISNEAIAQQRLHRCAFD